MTAPPFPLQEKRRSLEGRQQVWRLFALMAADQPRAPPHIPLALSDIRFGHRNTVLWKTDVSSIGDKIFGVAIGSIIFFGVGIALAHAAAIV